MLAVVNSDECAGSVFLAIRSMLDRQAVRRSSGRVVAQPVAGDGFEIWLDGVTGFDL
ncbi:hypothetical protein HFO94_14300 [Rhizobium leguminosarum]|uniref:hypothetical protein n=1 Tax=Rhizobium TaxID=379 RepID=UPI00138977DD|nr:MULTISPECIES: hypothetical protein [Rhizobium]MBY5354687.1 hypothetical protein [Rhizobium leguminosarum]MBY5369959.1 hypothetical protein [Rhizobium leguminosarum]MBY5452967.1 hypothetical protein [Rhizobium leguminosarum]NDK50068.1 hypothetical protein [Rhizobium laguerreae]NNH43286.1 hypothetical protein [Rhizobium laguerreae]